MGYVHTYGLTKSINEIPAEALTKIQEVVEKYKDILKLECDKDEDPVVTDKVIRFNGYGDKGYETFYFSVKELYHFCKTNTKDYDMPVSIILLLLFYYIPEFKLSSDGFWINKAEADEFTKNGKVELYGYWNDALDFMKSQYSLEFKWHLEVSNSGGHEYYCMNILKPDKPKDEKNKTERKAKIKVNSKDKENSKNKGSIKGPNTVKAIDVKIEAFDKTEPTETIEPKQEFIEAPTENKTHDGLQDKTPSKEKSKTKKSSDYSKEEKAEYFKNQLEDLKNSIEDKIQNFLDNSEELKNFLKFKNKHFRTYSFRNSLLIYNQFPKASYVAGFKKWQELGYTVNKGSKAIKILVPLIKKNEDKQEDSQEIYGFKSVSVFDISQVSPGPNAEPIPGLDLDVLSTENMEYPEDILFNACKTFVEAHCPLHIVNDDSLKDCLGLTNGKEIFLLDTKKPLDMAAVLIHEYAHLHNHFKENRKTLTKDQKETEAEITAMIFASYFNLNHENRFKYLAMYRKNRDLDKCFTTALNTFDYIILGVNGKNGLETILEGLKKEKNYEPKAS